MGLTFLVGGARSGKSALAVELGRRRQGPVVYVATAPSVDADMAERIARHRAERPDTWRTIEAPIDLEGAIAAAGSSYTIIDCLTLWVSNLMLADLDDAEIERRAASAAAAAAIGEVVAISNEVGLGVHPERELARRYRDLLGRVNQTWAAAAETGLLLVAGRALPLADPLTLLDAAP